MKYKVFNVKDLLSEIHYEGVRKGTKTEVYLENVIDSINKTGKYKWVQFFQLVDVFYVVVQATTTKTAQEEIKDHYSSVEPVSAVNVETSADKVGETISKPVSLKTTVPWKK